MITRGQPIIMGVPGPYLPQSTADLIERIQPGGFILFNRNIRDPQELFDLIQDLNNLCHIQPIITIDQEGGRVARLRTLGEEPVSGQTLCQTGKLEWCAQHGTLTGKLLHLFGFNLNLAPVVDYSLDERAENSLRGRCMGNTPDQAVERGLAFLRAMQAEGVLGTAKHFPGYTFCQLDPHGELPRIDRTEKQMLESELHVFSQFIDEAPVFMIGHAHFPHWHTDPFPASLSQKIIRDLLQDQMGYKGLVMSDDLEMGAIANRYPSLPATRMALEAGSHALLLCHNPACAQIAFDELCRLPSEIIAPAIERMEAFKKKLPPPPGTFDEQAFGALNKETRQLRETCEAAIAAAKA